MVYKLIYVYIAIALYIYVIRLIAMLVKIIDSSEYDDAAELHVHL